MVVDSTHEIALAHGEGADSQQPSPRRGDRWYVAVCLAVLSAPLLVALIGFRRSTWTPVLDLAMTELRVRDVGGAHTPLVGLPGRIGTLTEQGSHPGPLSFYALAPIYRLFGSTAWALQVATFVIHLVAMGTAVLIANRRGGRRLVVAIAALLAALIAGYGGGALTEPWNPYLPVLWWVVVLLAVWSVLCGDLPMLPVAVLAASFCAQTHIPYLGLAVGLGGVAILGAAAQWWRAPRDRRRVLGWGGAALVLGLLLWLPPTVDQMRHEPGNYGLLVEHFAHPPEEAQGLRSGFSSGVTYFDVAFLARTNATGPGGLVTNQPPLRPSTSRGAILLVVWAATAALAARRRDPVVLGLHVVVGAGTVLMVLAISRIFGRPWYYLTLWGWTIGLLALLAAVWTLARWASTGWRNTGRLRRPALATTALAVLGLAMTARFTVSAWDSTHADAPVARELAAVVAATAAGLEADVGVATGQDGRYVVTWSDAFHIGSQGYGLVNELERRGFQVGVDHGARVPVTRHRVLSRSGATARVHLATGSHIDRWRQLAGAVEIVSYDPRTDRERAEQARLRIEVIAALERLDLDDVIPKVDDNLFGAAIDDRVPSRIKDLMGRMLEIGTPLSVFVVPPTSPDP